MKEKAKKTKTGKEYWIHSYKNGFFYFENKSKYNEFFKKNFQGYYGTLLKYNTDYIVGFENISHYSEDAKCSVPFVFSHHLDLKKEAIKSRKKRRHQKCYRYRKPQVGKTIRGMSSLKTENSELKKEYNLEIKQRKKSIEIVGWFYDDFSHYKNQNNWKSDKRKMKKNWQKKIK